MSDVLDMQTRRAFMQRHCHGLAVAAGQRVHSATFHAPICPTWSTTMCAMDRSPVVWYCIQRNCLCLGSLAAVPGAAHMFRSARAGGHLLRMLSCCHSSRVRKCHSRRRGYGTLWRPHSTRMLRRTKLGPRSCRTGKSCMMRSSCNT